MKNPHGLLNILFRMSMSTWRDFLLPLLLPLGNFSGGAKRWRKREQRDWHYVTHLSDKSGFHNSKFSIYLRTYVTN